MRRLKEVDEQEDYEMVETNETEITDRIPQILQPFGFSQNMIPILASSRSVPTVS